MDVRENESHAKRSCVDLKHGVMYGKGPLVKELHSAPTLMDVTG
jgi:hypothetical protein